MVGFGTQLFQRIPSVGRGRTRCRMGSQTIQTQGTRLVILLWRSQVALYFGTHPGALRFGCSAQLKAKSRHADACKLTIHIHGAFVATSFRVAMQKHAVEYLNKNIWKIRKILGSQKCLQKHACFMFEEDCHQNACMGMLYYI